MAKVTLELGGKYTAADAFKGLGRDLDNAQVRLNTLGQSAKKGFRELASAVGGELAPALKDVGDIVDSFVKQDPIGMMVSSFKLGYNMVTSLIEQLDDLSVASANYDAFLARLSKGGPAVAKTLGDSVAELSSKIGGISKNFAEGVNAIKTDMALTLAQKVADIKLGLSEELGKEVDEASKRYLELQAQLNIAKETALAAEEENAAIIKAHNEKAAALEAARDEVNAKLEELSNKRATYEGWVINAEGAYLRALRDDAENAEALKAAWDKNKSLLADVNKQLETANNAKAKVDADIAKTGRDIATAQAKAAIAANENAAALNNAENALKEHTDAVAKAAEAEKAHALAAQAVASAQADALLQEQMVAAARAAEKEQVDRETAIMRLAEKAGLDVNEALHKYGATLEATGNADAALESVINTCIDAMQRQADAANAVADADAAYAEQRRRLSNATGGGGVSGLGDFGGGFGGTGGNMPKGWDSSRGFGNFRDWLYADRQAQRQERTNLTRIMSAQGEFNKWMKGELSAKGANTLKNYLKDFDPETRKKFYEKALKGKIDGGGGGGLPPDEIEDELFPTAEKNIDKIKTAVEKIASNLGLK